MLSFLIVCLVICASISIFSHKLSPCFLFHQPIRNFSCWTIFPSWWSSTWLSALLSQSVSASSVFYSFTILHGLFTRIAKQSSCPGTAEITMVVTVYLINSQLWNKRKSWCSCKYLLPLLNCKVARTLTPFFLWRTQVLVITKFLQYLHTSSKL